MIRRLFAARPWPRYSISATSALFRESGPVWEAGVEIRAEPLVIAFCVNIDGVPGFLKS